VPEPIAPAPADRLADLIDRAVADRIGAVARRPFVLGIAGAQGSGKSTLAALLAARHGWPVLSLDDLYLDGAARAALARSVHPLLRTRGVPGTHDVAAGLRAIEALAHRGPVLLPRFDKARDEPGAPVAFEGPAAVLVLEGWCLGARPQPREALAVPVNQLEREADPDGRWRRFVNDQLAGAYRELFARIDFSVLLAAPCFDVVADWRIEQERRAQGPMEDAEIREFVEYFRRITEGMIHNSAKTDGATAYLNANREVTRFEFVSERFPESF
jgi:D-glycerate 3-kinase